MSKKPGRSPARTVPKPKREPLPDMPQHKLPAPYSQLFRLGDGEFDEVYQAVLVGIRDPKAAVTVLVDMVRDLSYYDYDSEQSAGDAQYVHDPRSWTRLHALRVLVLLAEGGDDTSAAILPLLELLNDDDDYVNEEVADYYGAVGAPAIEPLLSVLMDASCETYEREAAGTSLQEIGSRHPELHAQIVAITEQALISAKDDSTLAAFLVCNLMDLGSKESYPIIETAFRAGLVDESVVQMADVEEHFLVSPQTPRKNWEFESLGGKGESLDLFEEEALAMGEALVASTNSADEEEEQEFREPFVAGEKTGRNEPCPCGSGKKYKKCCGA